MFKLEYQPTPSTILYLDILGTQFQMWSLCGRKLFLNREALVARHQQLEHFSLFEFSNAFLYRPDEEPYNHKN